jgi:hypothetical protein
LKLKDSGHPIKDANATVKHGAFKSEWWQTISHGKTKEILGSLTHLALPMYNNLYSDNGNDYADDYLLNIYWTACALQANNS